ncbi:MAG: hypothetical protein ABR499_14010 [Gemmatimonadaceae bacterium]
MRALVSALAILLAGGGQLQAQRGARLDVALPSRASDGGNGSAAGAVGPAVAFAHVLDDEQTRELVRAGFPAQLHFRLELWRVGRWVDELERSTEWDMVVGFDPASQSYRVRRRFGRQLEDLGAFATLASAQAASERPLRVPLTPRRPGRRYYYNLILDVEALSVSDLDQLERWLRGELRPAVRGENNPLSAIGSGARTLVTRILGGERRHYEKRSATFRAE